MQQKAFQQDGTIPLDAHPYRTLKRSKQSLAVFVEKAADSITIVAFGRVVPGDLSGTSNRNLEFDSCRMVTPGVSASPNTRLHSILTRALENRATLTPGQGDELASLISQFSKHAANKIKSLRKQMELKTVTGNAGFLLACEQDAVALSLKAANLHTQLSKLSTWSSDSPGMPFITGLKEAHNPVEFWSCPDHQVLRLQQDETPPFGWMRLTRDKRGSGQGVTLVNIRPIGDYEPAGADLIYLHPKFGALALLHYSPNRNFPDYVDKIDSMYADKGSLGDLRLAPRPGFIKFTENRKFEATRERLLSGTIHVAEHLRNVGRQHDGRFQSQRHLSNSTFAALLGSGWLGAREASYEKAREVVKMTLGANRAAVIAVHSEWEFIEQQSRSDQTLF
ncbi:hypothetical protein ACWEFJ_16970 [Actinosynnema sp. NPDC004786]